MIQIKRGICFKLTPPAGDTSKINGIVIINHGYSEHLSRYDSLAEMFTNDNWGVVTYDLRGHGDSAGDRGYISRFKQYLEDLDMIVEESKRLTNGEDKPIIFLAHSLGGLITLRYYLDEKYHKKLKNVKALVLCAPFVKYAGQISKKINEH